MLGPRRTKSTEPHNLPPSIFDQVIKEIFSSVRLFVSTDTLIIKDKITEEGEEKRHRRDLNAFQLTSAGCINATHTPIINRGKK